MAQPIPNTDDLSLQARALYDQLMAPIEPELTHAGIATLREKYRGETPEKAALRRKRYQKAMKRYEEAFAAYVSQVQQHHRESERHALRSTEMMDRELEEFDIADLASVIAAA